MCAYQPTTRKHFDMESDPFDDILGLEEQFYNEGHQLGLTDGAKAGRIEGRVFGLEKGFEKFVESGRVHGRATVWAGRLSKASASNKEEPTSVLPSSSSTEQPDASVITSTKLPTLSDKGRIEKHIRVLYALMEPATLSTENTEDAVSDFDDRFKRAQGKIKIIEKVLGEEGVPTGNTDDSTGNPNAPGKSKGDGANIEDVDILKARH